MTISNDTNSNSYAGNDATTLFNYDFKIFAATDLVVKIVDANDNETLQVLNTDYTVQSVGESSGTITMTVAPATGETLSIVRNVPFSQPTQIGNQANFLPGAVETGLDRLAIQVAQILQTVNNGVAYDPAQSGVLDFQNKRGINALDPVNNQDVATLAYVGAQVAAALTGEFSINPSKWQISGDNITTQFNIAGATVGVDGAYVVSVDDVVLEPTTDYQIGTATSPPTITFTTAPPTGTNNVWVQSLGYNKQYDSIPTISPGDDGKIVTVNAAETGFELLTWLARLTGAAAQQNRIVTTNAAGTAFEYSQVLPAGTSPADNTVDEDALTSSVAGAGLSGGNGSALDVGVDNTTTEISSDQVVVKTTNILTALGFDIDNGASNYGVEIPISRSGGNVTYLVINSGVISNVGNGATKDATVQKSVDTQWGCVVNHYGTTTATWGTANCGGGWKNNTTVTAVNNTTTTGLDFSYVAVGARTDAIP